MWKSKQQDVFYEQLCEQNIRNIYKYCARLTKGQSHLTDIAEDCTQKTFLEAGKQIVTLQNHPNVKGWLYVTAKNLVRNSYRGMYIKRKYEIVFDDQLKLISEGNELAACLEESYDIKELSEQVLSVLSKSEYDLYHDYFRNRLSIIELSEKYYISSTAVTTRIYRVKKKLKDKIKDCCKVI
ncbi:RNA polymerase subunit sigma-70 [Paenibacillus sp. IHB B 3415]|uniref:RNA polymerase sigma factor n=1 Tax=Paenibacillus sp. IHB B 3415 TaxID=867080 RepID=UPI000573EF53|nr:sigma-70 family RNA polymerase sigma factor [Paenibacillus sp. IHB B 3415]KHL91338.1 RNA polymerase subunit sigma-70 [Paenibacillus sp. IHB B 3415]